MKGEPWLVLGDSNKVGTSHPLWPIRHMVTGLLRFQQHGGSVQLWGQNQRSLRGDKTPFGPSGRGWLIYISPEAGSRVYAERPLHRTLWMTFPLLMSLARNASLSELVVAPVHTGCVAGFKSCRLWGLIIPKNLVFTFRGLCTRGPAGVWDSLIHWIYPTSGLWSGKIPKIYYKSLMDGIV